MRDAATVATARRGRDGMAPGIAAAVAAATPPDAAAAPQGRYLGTLRAQAMKRRLAADAAAAQRDRDALRATGAWREFVRRLVQTLRLMVGVHDYEQYVAHMRLTHPDAAPLTREAFHRRCVEARYGGGGKAGRCPC